MSFITRIAPSPTGDFHIGTARTAYFNWLAAKASGGRFIVRIDDTDNARNKQECVDVIYDTLSWLGLDWNATFKQSDRKIFYDGIAEELVRNGFATNNPDGSVIFRWDNSYPRVWTDEVVGDVPITDDDAKRMNGIVLIRNNDSGNGATYHFASVVDDYMSMINFIIRGSDHITNTSRQVAIWSAISQSIGHKRDVPRFAHVGLLFHDGKKISKRDGAASCLSYKNNDVDPDALLNFLLRLGWSPSKDDKSTAIITKDRAISMFLAEGKMRASNANADFVKLDSFNRKYKGMKLRAQ